MAAIGTESIPTSWDDERDNPFFRITTALFSSDFTYGAGVLLASYDETTTATPAAPVSAPVGHWTSDAFNRPYLTKK